MSWGARRGGAGRGSVDPVAVRRDDEAIEAVAARKAARPDADRAMRLLAALAVEVDTGLPRPRPASRRGS